MSILYAVLIFLGLMAGFLLLSPFFFSIFNKYLDWVEDKFDL